MNSLSSNPANADVLKTVLLVLRSGFFEKCHERNDLSNPDRAGSVPPLLLKTQNLLESLKVSWQTIGMNDLLAVQSQAELMGPFDAVVCLDVFERAGVLEGLRAALRSLKLGGELLIVNAVLQGDDFVPLREAWAPSKGTRGESQNENLAEGSNEVLKGLESGVGVPLFNLTQQCARFGAQELAPNASGLLDLSPLVSALEEGKRIGHICRVCMRRQKVSEAHHHIEHLSSQNLEDYEALFRLAFESEPTPGLWDFKFNQGRGFSLGLYQVPGEIGGEGEERASQSPELMAHYGGIKREILYFGKPALALQIGDVMVNPKGNQSLSRRGPFFQLATTFLEEHIGLGRQALLGVGFPNQKAMKVAALLGIYKEVDAIKEIAWRAKAGFMPFWETVVEVNPGNFSQVAPLLNALWELMKVDFLDVVIGVRHAQYVFDRYFERPGKRYELKLLINRFTKQPIGLMVFNVDESRFEMIDVIAPKMHFRKLVSLGRRFALSHASKELLFRITQSQAGPWMVEGARINELDIRIPANAWTERPDLTELENRWWLTSGDMDFV